MIDFDLIAWDDEDDPAGECPAHRGQWTHDRGGRAGLVRPGQPTDRQPLQRPAVFGRTATGTDILVVYEVLETGPVIVIRPVTAYEPQPE